MTLSDNQIQILKTIQAKLIRGDNKAIAKNTRMTEDYVSSVLNPERDTYNDVIVSEAARIISEREQKRQSLLRKLTA